VLAIAVEATRCNTSFWIGRSDACRHLLKVASGGSDGRNKPPDLNIRPSEDRGCHRPARKRICGRFPQAQANGDHRTSFAPEMIATRRNKHDRTCRIVRKINAGDLCPPAHNGLVEVRVLPGPPTISIAYIRFPVGSLITAPDASRFRSAVGSRCTIFSTASDNVLDGTVIGSNMKRHRHQEFTARPSATGRRTVMTPFKTPLMTPCKLFGRLFRNSAYQMLIAVRCREGFRCRPPPPASSPTNVRQSVQMFPSACFRDASAAMTCSLGIPSKSLKSWRAREDSNF
jgi:hypothetical protein